MKEPRSLFTLAPWGHKMNTMEQHTLTIVWIPTFSLTQRHLIVKVLIYIKMLFIFSTPVLIRHLWQLKTVVFLHWCLIHSLISIFMLLCHLWIKDSYSYFSLVSLLLSSFCHWLFAKLRIAVNLVSKIDLFPASPIYHCKIIPKCFGKNQESNYIGTLRAQQHNGLILYYLVTCEPKTSIVTFA